MCFVGGEEVSRKEMIRMSESEEEGKNIYTSVDKCTRVEKVGRGERSCVREGGGSVVHVFIIFLHYLPFFLYYVKIHEELI